MKPLLTYTLMNPEFQIAQAPAYMYDTQGNLLDSTYTRFAQLPSSWRRITAAADFRTYTLLPATASDGSVEVMAAKHADGTLTVMDHAVAASADVNGAGAPRTVEVDLSAWLRFSSETLVTVDAGTDVATGPQPVSVTPASTMTLNFSGYGVDFLILKP